MHRFTACLLLTMAIAACGSSRDPHPENRDESIRVRAGSSEVGFILLEEGDFDHWGDFEDTDYWYWNERVRGLPSGFDYDTIDVDDDDDGELSVVYEVEVAPWVRPGRYRFEVRYEFWPDDSLFREEFRIEIRVKVKSW